MIWVELRQQAERMAVREKAHMLQSEWGGGVGSPGETAALAS